MRAVTLMLVWVLVILYPDPGLLVRSLHHFFDPRIDPQAVAALAAPLPDDPVAIEAYVLDEVVPYAYDWQASGVPWYFPTTREVLAAGRGDCESRAVVLASFLTAKGIPNDLRMSFDHIWVDYPGKRDSAMENAAVQVAGSKDGELFLRWPSDFDLRRELADQVAIHWTPAPAWRRGLLVGGLLLLPLGNVLAGLVAGAGLRPGGLRPAPAAPAPAGRRERFAPGATRV
jgi:hypothetical protein